MRGDTSYTLLMPGLLSDEAAGTGPLKALLDAGELSREPAWQRPHTYESLLAQASGYPDGLPGAALAWRAQFPDTPAPTHLVSADLMDLQAVARGLHFGDGPMDLTESEQEALHALLAPLVTESLGEGAVLHAGRSRRWFIELLQAPAASLISPGDASELGAGMSLPGGPDGAVWAGLMNASQIALHEHPLNDEREARGAAPVTSLWFSGSGSITPQAEPWSAVFSDCPVARDLALGSGTRWHALVDLDTTREGRVLVADRASRPEPALLQAIDTLREALTTGTISSLNVLDPEHGEALLRRRGMRGWLGRLVKPNRAAK